MDSTFQTGLDDDTDVYIDGLIAYLDSRISDQMNEILHHAEFQQMEAAWRSLYFLLEGIPDDQNIRVEVLSVSKQDLLDDFVDIPDIVKTGLYRHVYTAEYGQFGGKPIAAIIADYEIKPTPDDMFLLEHCASVAAMAHAPFIAGADKAFFRITDWAQLPNLSDLHSLFDMPSYARWRSFRQNPDARYAALVLPRFLLRIPYGGASGIQVKSFSFFEETYEDENFCWGNAAFCFAQRLADSFAKYRWCSNIIGPQGGGTVEHLPFYQYEMAGSIHTRIPLQVIITERREYALAEEGFISLCFMSGTDSVTFFSANSCLASKRYPDTEEGRLLEVNFLLSTQLPYMMIVNRLAHYIKVIQRENLGTWRQRRDIERELNLWIAGYVTEMEDPDPKTRSRRPLRAAHIDVEENENTPGWYTIRLTARPHFKYMGANFTLSLVGKLDRE